MPEQMDRLLSKLEECFDMKHILEYTVEAGRPDSITREKLQVLKDHHVSRISINPQTMNQKTLDLIGRRHTVEETKAAFFMAREMGFDNINMDLIVGLPGEEKEDVEQTLKEVILSLIHIYLRQAKIFSLSEEDWTTAFLWKVCLLYTSRCV